MPITTTLLMIDDASLQQKISSLTTRENEVIEMCSAGFSSKEIGEKLKISYRTVHAHRQNCLQKLGARNIAHAVKLRQISKITRALNN